MTINPLSTSFADYVQPVTNNAGLTNTGALTVSLPQDGSPEISPAAQLLSGLQQLQEQDPAQYQQVTSQIANQLHKAAATQLSSGNTALATQLNQLGDQFQDGSTGGPLPTPQALQQAGVTGHGHHHHHGHHGSGQTTQNSLLNMLDGASSSTSGNSSGE
jgi:hypothetical protein